MAAETDAFPASQRGDFERSWVRAWSGIGGRGGAEALRDALIARYAEPHRRYHGQQHLSECLTLFESTQHLAARPAEVEIALWFHDAIYDPTAKDNEAGSADWARSALRDAGVDAAAADRVHALVMATCHHAQPVGADQQLLVDIDLSILGADDARFQEYEQQIRDEYAFVPEALFRQKRGEILRDFLDRPRLYATELFWRTRESAARQNLRRALGA